MSAKDNGGPAFPLATGWVEDAQDGGAKKVVLVRELNHGMTLRDYFAAHAPTTAPHWWRGGEDGITSITEWRFYYADAMLKARNA